MLTSLVRERWNQHVSKGHTYKYNGSTTTDNGGVRVSVAWKLAVSFKLVHILSEPHIPKHWVGEASLGLQYLLAHAHSHCHC